MTTQFLSAPLGAIRAASPAGGLACTTAPAYQAIPAATRHLQLVPHNFAAAKVVRYLLNPYLLILKSADSIATVTDYSEAAQDNDTVTRVVLDALSTLANGDLLLVGASSPFAGVHVVAGGGNVNAVVNTLLVSYWNGTAWTTISAADGTAVGGASLATTGDVGWAVPTDWVKAALRTVDLPGGSVPSQGDGLYWTRWTWSVALSATVRPSAMLAINRSTAYAEMPSGFATEFGVGRGIGPGGIGCLQVCTDIGTANLVINCATRAGDAF